MSSSTMKSSPKCSNALGKGWKPLYSPLYARNSSPVTACMSVKTLALAARAAEGLSRSVDAGERCGSYGESGSGSALKGSYWRARFARA